MPNEKSGGTSTSDQLSSSPQPCSGLPSLSHLLQGGGQAGATYPFPEGHTGTTERAQRGWQSRVLPLTPLIEPNSLGHLLGHGSLSIIPECLSALEFVIMELYCPI